MSASDASQRQAGGTSPKDSILVAQFLGKPAWMWLAFFAIVVILLVLDLGVLHRKAKEIEVRESLVLSGIYISLGVSFGA
jgi:tellurite resistance protein TerC